MLRKAVYAALREAMDMTESEASAHIFRAYGPSPPADPGLDFNACYYHIVSEPGEVMFQEKSLAHGVPVVSSFVPVSLILVFYGPDCEAWAHRCQEFLFLDGGGKPRSILRAAGLFLIPSSAAPAVIYEETGKTFRKRADLTLAGRLLVNAPYASVLTPDAPVTVPTIASPPSVSIHTNLKGEI